MEKMTKKEFVDGEDSEFWIIATSNPRYVSDCGIAFAMSDEYTIDPFAAMMFEDYEHAMDKLDEDNHEFLIRLDVAKKIGTRA